MTRRKLTSEEIDLWQRVVQKTEALHPGTHSTPPPAPLPKPKPAKVPVSRFENFEVGQNTKTKPLKNDLKPAVNDGLRAAGLQMDFKSFGRMKRGKIKPEGRIDLHGMRLENAHSTLVRFVLSSQASGKRLVLVITGKGKDRDEPGPIPTPRGVLRHQVPQWLSLPPLAQAVLQVTPAHLRHGGDGAYYVYLRRNR
ncbi:MAG: DNA mismatch repair protein MutS [Rhodobacteraceae bacterium]|nr:DNA mismatch repair protein MutS [Paracoccaceae bacterium]